MCQGIIQAGVDDSDKYEDMVTVIASKRMLDSADVRYYKFQRPERTVTIVLYFLLKRQGRRIVLLLSCLFINL